MTADDRMIPIARVLEILDKHRNDLVHGLDFELNEIRDEILAEVTPTVSAATVAAKITLTESQIKEAGAIAHRLNDSQRTALLQMAEAAPKYRMGVVPTGRYAAPSTALALDRRGLVTWRSVPRQGYQLTDMGRAAVASLRDA